MEPDGQGMAGAGIVGQRRESVDGAAAGVPQLLRPILAMIAVDFATKIIRPARSLSRVDS